MAGWRLGLWKKQRERGNGRKEEGVGRVEKGVGKVGRKGNRRNK